MRHTASCENKSVHTVYIVQIGALKDFTHYFPQGNPPRVLFFFFLGGGVGVGGVGKPSIFKYFLVFIFKTIGTDVPRHLPP